MSENSQKKTLDEPKVASSEGKKRDRSASEERLIKAGRDIFAKHGFDGATTRMIAKKADVNESLIGRYFDGKEGLLIAIIQLFLEEKVHRELSFPPQESLTKELEMYSEDRLKMGCLQQDFAKIIFTQALVNRKFKARILETVPMQLDPRLIERVEILAKSGKLKATANVTEICEDVDSFMGGVFFNDCILHEMPLELILKRTQSFLKKYAQLFEKA